VHHSDRGRQDGDTEYLDALRAAGIERSMNRVGNGYDNASMDSFWRTLKTDTGLATAIPDSRQHTALADFDYIETFCNPGRPPQHHRISHPVVFENQQKPNDSNAA
jgi:transposase InsO family protein